MLGKCYVLQNHFISIDIDWVFKNTRFYSFSFDAITKKQVCRYLLRSNSHAARHDFEENLQSDHHFSNFASIFITLL